MEQRFLDFFGAFPMASLLVSDCCVSEALAACAKTALTLDLLLALHSMYVTAPIFSAIVLAKLTETKSNDIWELVETFPSEGTCSRSV